MLENKQEVLDALVPRLVERIRNAVRHKEPYELAFERIVTSGESDARLSKPEGFKLRGEVERAYLAVVKQEAKLPKSTGTATKKISGKIPRHSTPEQRREIFSSKDRQAGEEAEARHDEQVQS